MDNTTIAQHFNLLSKLMTLHEENAFKIRSYANAARQIERLPTSLSSMPSQEIGQIPGIGKAIQQKIQILLDTGQLPLLEKFIEHTPKGIRDMLEIKGIGAKKLATIWKKMGIETPGELLYACNEDRLTRYKGFGAKTQENIKKVMAYYLKSLGSFLYADAKELSDQLLENWKKKTGEEAVFLPTGDLRRQANTLTTIELVTNLSAEELLDYLPAGFKKTIGNNSKTVLAKEAHPEVAIYHGTKKQIGSLLFKTTGNDDFITSVYKLNPAIEHKDFHAEAEIFENIAFPFIIPALREYTIKDLPCYKNIIQPKDIKGIIHAHSTWSDGKNSIEEMALAAKELGMEYLVISDHSGSAAYAQGLNRERVLAQQKEIDRLNKKFSPFKIFKSIESDILSDGTLDYEDDILATFDLVIASVHSNLKMNEKKATERLLTAISNPYTTILGHATGRLLLSREGYPVDHQQIINACVANKVAIEINAHPRRLDMDWRYIPYALQQKALFSINPDAHSTEGVKAIQYGVWSAQKGGLSAKDNLSSYSLKEFENYLIS